MKILRKDKAIARKNSDVCIVTEYEIGDPAIDFAIVNISGRYPEMPTQRAVNRQCKEIVYVHEGAGKVIVNNNEHLLNAGDVVLIEAGEAFYWQGNLTLHISCHPAFTVEQHQIVED